MFPKVKIEIVSPDDAVDKIVQRIQEVCRTGQIGDGKIFIYPVENIIRIRTREQGEKAL